MHTPFVAMEILFVVFIFAFELDLTVDRILAVRLRYNDTQRERSVLNRGSKVGLITSDHTFLKEEK